jgi:murein DD-endopeptidase MepM/ murein hydrolase activator NlpD
MVRGLNCMKWFNFILSGVLLSTSACSALKSRYHTVSAGDSLPKIAKKYDISVAALQAANGGMPSRLPQGEKIFIPFESNPDWDKQFYETEAEPEPEREVASPTPSSEAFPKIAFHWPVKGTISSRFGSRYLRGRGRHFHEGIDIAARKGTPVKSARSGHVVYATNKISGYGNMVIVQHADSFSTVYAHLTKILVKKGQFVSRSQLVGTVGRTGRSTGHHLHFEVRSSRRPIDPMPVLYEQYARGK